jgi:hypothetical protein
MTTFDEALAETRTMFDHLLYVFEDRMTKEDWKELFDMIVEELD